MDSIKCISKLGKEIVVYDDKYSRVGFDESCKDARFIIIAIPTYYDKKTNLFNTDQVKKSIKIVSQELPDTTIVISSMVPVGFTLLMSNKYKNIMYCADFSDSRIIIGVDLENTTLVEKAHSFATILCESVNKDIPTRIMGMSEAETVRLYSNTYLAMREAYFNELDTFAKKKGLDIRKIIEGVCSDARIGKHDNVPSFGYGELNLPNSKRQVKLNHKVIVKSLLEKIVKSNSDRKNFIAEQILERMNYYSEFDAWDRNKEKKVVVGIYRLTVNNKNDNYKDSPMHEIMEALKSVGVEVLIFEPCLNGKNVYCGSKVVNDLNVFKELSMCILANHYDRCLDDVKDKVYTRDCFA